MRRYELWSTDAIRPVSRSADGSLPVASRAHPSTSPRAIAVTPSTMPILSPDGAPGKPPLPSYATKVRLASDDRAFRYNPGFFTADRSVSGRGRAQHEGVLRMQAFCAFCRFEARQTQALAWPTTPAHKARVVVAQPSVEGAAVEGARQFACEFEAGVAGVQSGARR